MPDPSWKIDNGPREELPWWEDHTKIKLAATVIVTASVCGIIWYAYFSGDGIKKSETNGATTVINASQEPVRARPTEPGGQQIPHQNATVYERLNVDTAPTIEQPAPSPEKPMEKPTTPTATVLAPLPLPQAQTGQPASTTPEQPITRLPLSDHTELSQAQPVPSSVPAEPVKITEAPLAAPVSQPLAPAPVQPETPLPLSEPKPKPKPKPEPIPQPITKVAPGTGSNTYRIQIAAVASEEKAQSTWKTAIKKHSFLSGLTLTVDKVTRSGNLFYRVQAGPFDSKQAAADMCSKLKSNNAACMIVKP